MTNHNITEERKHTLALQSMDLSNLNCNGTILDVGGGGEGIIGQLFGDKVISIDPNRAELEEAPGSPIKIVMDARDMKFLNNTFDFATSFFTMMFIKKADHRLVFKEIFRVLKTGGELILWDINIPEYTGGKKDIFVFPLKVDLGEKTIETGYGTLWPGSEQDMHYYADLGEEVGFTVINKETTGEAFYIRYKK